MICANELSDSPRRSRSSNDKDELDLLDIIQAGVAKRGFYVLIDDRLKLLCGTKERPRNLRDCAARLSEFAYLHNLRAEVHRDQVIFLPIQLRRPRGCESLSRFRW